MNHVEMKQDLNIILRIGIILAAVFALATIGSAILFFVMKTITNFGPIGTKAIEAFAESVDPFVY